MSTVKRVQNAICRIEGFQIRILYANGSDVRDDRADLPIQWYERAAKDKSTVAQWISERFKKKYPGYGVVVVDAYGKRAHGRTLLFTVRSTYK